MKNPGRIVLLTASLSILLWSCTKNESLTNSTTLKQSISESSANLNKAMESISSSNAFSILTVSDGTMKSSASTTDSLYKVYIPLDKIKGIYDYKPGRWGKPLLSFFNKSADNNKMIVRMPLEKVVNPRTLRHYSAADPLLKNNFAIAVSEYHNNYNNYSDFDYILASEIGINDEVAGSLNIKSQKSKTLGTHYSSQYAFNGGYTAKYKYDSGDTTVSSFAILSGAKILYEERLLTSKKDTSRFGRESQYSLTIGDVMIIRKSGTAKVEVYVKGVLQPNAIVTIIDKVTDPEASVCKKRDIQITFEDGTTTTVSALIGASITNIKTLFESLHSVYFAAYIVDWIAYDIYYQRN